MLGKAHEGPKQAIGSRRTRRGPGSTAAAGQGARPRRGSARERRQGSRGQRRGSGHAPAAGRGPARSRHRGAPQAQPHLGVRRDGGRSTLRNVSHGSAAFTGDGGEAGGLLVPGRGSALQMAAGRGAGWGRLGDAGTRHAGRTKRSDSLEGGGRRPRHGILPRGLGATPAAAPLLPRRRDSPSAPRPARAAAALGRAAPRGGRGGAGGGRRQSALWRPPRRLLPALVLRAEGRNNSFVFH